MLPQITETSDKVIVAVTKKEMLGHLLKPETWDMVCGLCKPALARSKRLVLNFEGVQFLDSSALGQLIKLHRQAQSKSVAMRLSGLRPEIIHVFRLTGLDRRIQDDDDEPECACPNS